MTDTATDGAGPRLLTPSKITAWLECPHYLHLKHQVEAGTRRAPGSPMGSFAQLLLDKGLLHEQRCLDAYRAEGRTVLEVPGKERGERFDEWADRVAGALDGDHDVVYQLPLVHDGVRGVADFLLRRTDPDTGAAWWEPVDAKLARRDAKPGHVLQLCSYAEALAARTGNLPRQVHLWLGSGRVESIATAEVLPYWNRLRDRLRRLLDSDVPAEPTRPEPCAHCAFCEFAGPCDDQLRSEDSLVFVAGLRSDDRARLQDAGIGRLAELARHDPADQVPDVRPERLLRVTVQAALQAQARDQPADASPPWAPVQPVDDDSAWGHGFGLLPPPDDGDVFFDLEGHPFWEPDTGLVFLYGVLARDRRGQWEYRTWWAHDRTQEAAATAGVVEWFAERRREHPGMHVYHYNHTERSTLEHLTAEHGVAQRTLEVLLGEGAFVDLLPAVRNALQAGVESYGLKHVERLTDYVRGHDIDAGAGAVLEYEHWRHDHDDTRLERIAAYNTDDVAATRALRDWLVDRRPAALAWRDATLEPEAVPEDLDDQVARLHAHGPGTPEHLLGDVRGYWLRESRAARVRAQSHLEGDAPALLEDPEVVAALAADGEFVRQGKRGPLQDPGMAFRFPPQTLTTDLRVGSKLLFGRLGEPTAMAQVEELDRDAGTVSVVWGTRCQELPTLPTAGVRYDAVRTQPKPEALSEFAEAVLDPATHGGPNPATLALLRRDLPRFLPGGGPVDGRFDGDADDLPQWVRRLDHSVLAVQGPPGTGKTFQGARIIHHLIGAGLRVGVTAFSHHAIDNLLIEAQDHRGRPGAVDDLRVVRKTSPGRPDPLDFATYTTSNDRAANHDFRVVAGTTWLFAGRALRDDPVDVLLVDEAGQLSLADALAASTGARNVVLLGDPLQLPQVTQAAHPGGSGASVLQHVLDGAATMPADRGVFLDQTRRMHPDVCRFISDCIYDGRLATHATCADQGTDDGTGVRWLQARHDGRSTESPEEADLVAAEISRLRALHWTDQHGIRRPLEADDFMVVAPYNDQVRLLRERLDADPSTRGVPVGTVDRFQGQQAAVVFFTMTSSSSADAPRDSDFLFSRNRLNVAVSRARCLAYLVCTEALADSRARDLDEMRLLATLCAFIEHADG